MNQPKMIILSDDQKNLGDIMQDNPNLTKEEILEMLPFYHMFSKPTSERKVIPPENNKGPWKWSIPLTESVILKDE